MRGWKKHGIIERRRIAHAYFEASASTDVRGKHVKEGPTVTFWSTIFIAQIFHGGSHAVTSQSNPGKVSLGTNKAVDLEVNYFTKRGTQSAILLAEAKRTPVTIKGGMQPADVVKLEGQIEDYGRLYLEKFPLVKFIYLASLVSTSCRLWIMKRPSSTKVTETGKTTRKKDEAEMEGMWNPRD
jgi:hypothetical protein